MLAVARRRPEVRLFGRAGPAMYEEVVAMGCFESGTGRAAAGREDALTVLHLLRAGLGLSHRAHACALALATHRQVRTYVRGVRGVCACNCACARAPSRACVRARVRACMRACVRVRARVAISLVLSYYTFCPP